MFRKGGKLSGPVAHLQDGLNKARLVLCSLCSHFYRGPGQRPVCRHAANIDISLHPVCCPARPVPSSCSCSSSLDEEEPRGIFHKACLALKWGTSQGTEQALCPPTDPPLHTLDPGKSLRPRMGTAVLLMSHYDFTRFLWESRMACTWAILIVPTQKGPWGKEKGICKWPLAQTGGQPAVCVLHCLPVVSYLWELSVLLTLGDQKAEQKVSGETGSGGPRL